MNWKKIFIHIFNKLFNIGDEDGRRKISVSLVKEALNLMFDCNTKKAYQSH